MFNKVLFIVTNYNSKINIIYGNQKIIEFNSFKDAIKEYSNYCEDGKLVQIFPPYKETSYYKIFQSFDGNPLKQFMWNLNKIANEPIISEYKREM